MALPQEMLLKISPAGNSRSAWKSALGRAVRARISVAFSCRPERAGVAALPRGAVLWASFVVTRLAFVLSVGARLAFVSCGAARLRRGGKSRSARAFVFGSGARTYRRERASQSPRLRGSSYRVVFNH